MSYEFKRLSDVEVVETPSETANVLIEENGVIKKVAKATVGGGSDNSIILYIPSTTVAEAASSNYITGATCNKTFEEVYELFASNNIGLAVIRRSLVASCMAYQQVYADIIAAMDSNGNPVSEIAQISDIAAFCLGTTSGDALYYYSDGGISTKVPGGVEE